MNLFLISGSVHNGRGEPIAGARIFFTAGPSPLPDVALLSGPRGEFVLSVKNSGRYKLACAADGFETASKIITLEPGNSQATIQFRLEP